MDKMTTLLSNLPSKSELDLLDTLERRIKLLNGQQVELLSQKFAAPEPAAAPANTENATASSPEPPIK